MTTQICPSILSADFANLERDLAALSSADMVHVDVMDNHFVPNLTLGQMCIRDRLKAPRGERTSWPTAKVTRTSS